MISIESYISCKNYSGKVTRTNQGLVSVQSATAKMKIFKCKYQSVARVVLEGEEGKEHKVTMFGKITDISKEFEGGRDGEDMSGLLLLSPHKVIQLT